MPQLNKTKAKAVTNAKSEPLAPFDDGVYGPFKLKEVTGGEGPAGPYWKWTYELVDAIPGHYKQQFLITSLSDKALFKLEETFSAHGVDSSTHTDELVGDLVMLSIEKRVIEKGKRAGELGNSVARVLPYEDASL